MEAANALPSIAKISAGAERSLLLYEMSELLDDEYKEV
jgi:hypothetical protein